MRRRRKKASGRKIRNIRLLDNQRVRSGNGKALERCRTQRAIGHHDQVFGEWNSCQKWIARNRVMSHDTRPCLSYPQRGRAVLADPVFDQHRRGRQSGLNRRQFRLGQCDVIAETIEQRPRAAALHPFENLGRRGERIAQPQRDQGIVDIALIREKIAAQGHDAQARTHAFDHGDRATIFVFGCARLSCFLFDATECVQGSPLLLHQARGLRRSQRRLQICLRPICMSRAMQQFSAIQAGLRNRALIARLLCEIERACEDIECPRKIVQVEGQRDTGIA